MENLEQDFKEFIELLNKHCVEYMIIGGYAVNFYCRPRYTIDIDFLINRQEQNAEKLIGVLQEFGFGSLGLTAADFMQTGQIIQLGYEPVRIDILNDIPGVNFTDAYANKMTTTIDNTSIHFIGLSDLKANKLAVGRNKDLDDVKSIIKVEKALAKKTDKHKKNR